MDYDQWFDLYKPIFVYPEAKDGVAPEDRTSYGGTMFETYGDELEMVMKHPQDRVWTLIDVDGKQYVVPGFHFVNRFGYFVTEVPHTGKPEEQEIPVDIEPDEPDEKHPYKTLAPQFRPYPPAQ